MRYIYDLDPSGDSNYVLLSNIYETTGSWHGASKVRKKMKAFGIKKKAGIRNNRLVQSPNFEVTVLMAASEASLQVLSGAVPCQIYPSLNFTSALSFKFSVKSAKNGDYRGLLRKGHGASQYYERNHLMTGTEHVLRGLVPGNWSKSFERNCIRSESVRETFTKDGSNRLVVENQSSEATEHLVYEKEGLLSKTESASAVDNQKTISSGDAESLEDEAWNLLRESTVYYRGNPVGTIAANDPCDSNPQNYDQVFIRDFIPSGIAFLLKGDYEIVRNFILHTLELQSWEKTMDCHSPGQGLMPASFKVRTVPLDGDESATEEILDPDFGQASIGRVAPVDFGLWWIILLRAYGKCSGDLSVQERNDVQTGIRMILKLCLADGFDLFPTLLVTEGSCMIDRRMGVHGHPLEIQSLFYSALLCAREMLVPEEVSDCLMQALNNRLVALSIHIRDHYWIDMKKLNEIYRYKTEENSSDAVNKFNIYPDQIPPWLVEWIPNKGGYLIGNLQPAHMDFRFFSLGNLWAIVCNLATTEQSHAILDLIEAKWSDLVADMPMKLCFPPLEGHEWAEWRIITGSDPKNTPWSYHNGGSWPTLLWQLTVACIKMKRPEIAEKAIKIAEKRLARDKWPEYYDTRGARFVGKQAHLFQTWSVAGYLAAKLLIANPTAANILVNLEDIELLNAYSCAPDTPRRNRSRAQKFIV